jgi:nucleoside-diphosphate-sugar epimerase
MRVMVTGGTGFVGGHTVKVLADAGHEVRLLVRNPMRIDETLRPLGVDVTDHVVGDMTDSTAVNAAIDGCDAVVHCAAVVTLSPRRVDALAANALGTRNVLDAAAERALDPIVVVSSASALFTPGVPVLHHDLPPTTTTTGYARSKADAEKIAREYQDAGAPVTITYPGGVLGPPVGGNFGEAAEGVVAHLTAGALVVRDAAMSAVDVRDVAAIHAATMQRGRGPRRYMCSGHWLTMPQLADVLHSVTGRRFPVLRVPGAFVRTMGRAMDAVTRVAPIESVFTEAGMTIHTRWPPSDDHLIADELGITLRPVEETLADTIRTLHAAGRLSARQAGRIALETRE